MINLGVNEIKRLSQEEGLHDSEIAVIMGIHRVTVTRIRKKHDIPTADLQKRKDKKVNCIRCKNMFTIRREDIKNGGYVCDQCKRTL